MLHNDLSNVIVKKLQKRIDYINVATYYQIAKNFCSKDLKNKTLKYIERFFTSVCETNNFLELDFNQVAHIVSSSELRIDSELEILSAADDWISYDFEKRRIFAKNLLLKVRLPLLPDNHLNIIAKMDMCFNEIKGCVSLLSETSQNSNLVYQNKPSSFYSSRFCSQNSFNIVISGGYWLYSKQFMSAHQEVDCRDFSVANELSPMKHARWGHMSFYYKNNIYVFAGNDNNGKYFTQVEKYSLITHKWKQVAKMSDDRTFFGACAFIDHIFVIGGRDDNENDNFVSCLKFNTKENHWKKIAKMNEERFNAACAVYKEKVVVTGGENVDGYLITTVKAYNHLSDTWTSMPNMLEGKTRHKSVSVKNKLYVIGNFEGRPSCEVFDSTKKFVALKNKSSTQGLSFINIVGTYSIGNKVVTLIQDSTTALVYDLAKGEWSKESLEATTNFLYFGHTVVPQVKF